MYLHFGNPWKCRFQIKPSNCIEAFMIYFSETSQRRTFVFVPSLASLFAVILVWLNKLQLPPHTYGSETRHRDRGTETEKRKQERAKIHCIVHQVVIGGLHNQFAQFRGHKTSCYYLRYYTCADVQTDKHFCGVYRMLWCFLNYTSPRLLSIVFWGFFSRSWDYHELDDWEPAQAVALYLHLRAYCNTVQHLTITCYL